MPETPADNRKARIKLRRDPDAERLATPEELAEFGDLPPDPDIEAQILALFEQQMTEPSLSDEPSIASPEVPHEITHGSADVITPVAPEPDLLSPKPDILRLDAPVPPELKESTAEGRELPTLLETAELPVVAESHRPKVDLLELAEALDQHKLWVETAGREGTRGDFSAANLSDADLTGVNLQGAVLQKTNLRGADLSMANLRGAKLVEADLRETNLLGAEFSGANLMGANLYGAQGLWAGRLGGTNLFDATLPEAVPAHDGGKAIAQFTQSARWFYLLLIAMCAGASVTVLLTKDVRLLLDQSAIPLSRIPNVLPLQGFFLGAPLLLTVLYMRLQFLLLRLWGSMGVLPAVFPDGQTPQKNGPWYLMGPIRGHLSWSQDPRSPLGLAEGVMAKLLVYWAVPAALFLLWLRYLVLQDYRGTLLQVFLFTLVAAAACGLPRIVARVLRPGDWADETTSQFLRDVLLSLRVPAYVGILLFLLSLGVIRGLPGDSAARPEIGRADPRRWAATLFQSLGFRPYADISEANISAPSAKPPAADENSNDIAGPRLNEMNLRFSRGYRASFANARMWRANLEGASFSEADFRGANLREAILRSARFDRAQAAKSNLISVDARAADLAGADFQHADLSYANLEGASLSTANVTRAGLYAVNLRRANLLRTDLSHADLRDAKLEGAVMSLAVLEETDLSAAKLVGANLTAAQVKGTILLEADLSHADLRGATMTGAILRQARLEGANFQGADLRGALGLEAWQICSAQGWRGAQLDPDVKLAAEQTCGSAQQGLP